MQPFSVLGNFLYPWKLLQWVWCFSLFAARTSFRLGRNICYRRFSQLLGKPWSERCANLCRQLRSQPASHLSPFAARWAEIKKLQYAELPSLRNSEANFPVPCNLRPVEDCLARVFRVFPNFLNRQTILFCFLDGGEQGNLLISYDIILIVAFAFWLVLFFAQRVGQTDLKPQIISAETLHIRAESYCCRCNYESLRHEIRLFANIQLG